MKQREKIKRNKERSLIKREILIREGALKEDMMIVGTTMKEKGTMILVEVVVADMIIDIKESIIEMIKVVVIKLVDIKNIGREVEKEDQVLSIEIIVNIIDECKINFITCIF